MAVSVKDLSSWKRTGSYRLLVEPDPVRYAYGTASAAIPHGCSQGLGQGPRRCCQKKRANRSSLVVRSIPRPRRIASSLFCLVRRSTSDSRLRHLPGLPTLVPAPRPGRPSCKRLQDTALDHEKQKSQHTLTVKPQSSLALNSFFHIPLQGTIPVPGRTSHRARCFANGGRLLRSSYRGIY